MSRSPAVLRFSRDRRGYESVYLVQPRGSNKPARILYWYRTPPGIKVGRAPFDDETRRRLEAQNPDVSFDWPQLVATPFPPPQDVERWRERREADRMEKAARAARRADLETAADEQEPDSTDEGVTQSPTDTADADASAADQQPVEVSLSAPAGAQPARRRRRRRRRRGRGQAGSVPPAGDAGSQRSDD